MADPYDHVAAWIEDFPGSKSTIKQKLAAVRMLYDFLVVRQHLYGAARGFSRTVDGCAGFLISLAWR
jgi:hypothetical protein